METDNVNKIVFVTGGARSGKSRYAISAAEGIVGRRVLLATAQASDAEMEERISRHQAERDAQQWETIEEPLDLIERLAQLTAYDVVVVDCLTLWLSNMILATPRLTEDEVQTKGQELVQISQQVHAAVFFVTNEVGMGVHPTSDLGRKFCDLQGRLNQSVAKSADETILMVSGKPLRIA